MTEPPDRILVILRHAKAAEPGSMADLDRPLSDRGHADAAAAGAWLDSQGHHPDLVICSPARRTRQTWHEVVRGMSRAARATGGGRGAAATGDGPPVAYERAVYDAGADELLELIRATGDEVRTVLVIGHNPTVTRLSRRLAPERTRDSDGLRTSGIAVHRVTGGWAECDSAPLVAEHTARA